jgi:hypothetical protein
MKAAERSLDASDLFNQLLLRATQRTIISVREWRYKSGAKTRRREGIPFLSTRSKNSIPHVERENPRGLVKAKAQWLEYYFGQLPRKIT